MLVVLLVAVCATTVALAVAYLVPPSGSVRALRKRVTDCEELAERLETRLARHIKRYRSLEGHVYGSMDDEEPEDVSPLPASGAAGATPGQGSLELVPSDFPEEEFQAALARSRQQRGGG